MQLKKKDRKKIFYAAFVLSLLILTSIVVYNAVTDEGQTYHRISIDEVLDLTSERSVSNYDHVLLEKADKRMALMGTYISCWYDIEDGSTNLLPLLIDGSPGVERVRSYTMRNTPLILPSRTHLTTGSLHFSSEIARSLFQSSSGALVIESDGMGYELGAMTAPMASYLNIPILIADPRDDASYLEGAVRDLECSYLIVVGEKPLELVRGLDIGVVIVDDDISAFETTARVVQDRFGRLDYITMTNPRDTIPRAHEDEIVNEQYQEVDSILIDTNTYDIDLVGESVMTHSIDVLEGMVDLRVDVNFTDIVGKPLDPLKKRVNVDPISFMTLRDPQGRLIASSPSFSIGRGMNRVETLVMNNPGRYELEVKVYYGVKGLSTMMGTSLGFSRFEGGYSVETRNRLLSDPNLPLYRDLSMMAPYLSASRGGLVLAAGNFSLYGGDLLDAADGYSTGPWYEKDLLGPASERAYSNAEYLSKMIDILPGPLRETYLNEHGWLAILGGGNMIPMSYEEKDPSWEEDVIWGTGWATDIPYSLDLQLSVGRPLGRTVSDCSALISRTLFYEEYTEGHIDQMESEYGQDGSWKDHFHFLAGEGGGRTGWLFHQREFSSTAEEHGFTSEVYVQDYENGREYMVSQGAFERANYFEMILHGDWSWFSPELNGWDRYSTGVRVTDILRDPGDWELGPSVFNSGVCLLGRIGGLLPEQSITQAFFHAGINAFFCATRSTGSEAKAGPIEEALIFEDLSTGEAIRNDKRSNPEVPTCYVRTLYGDPAFDPYEPENGFGDQGIPGNLRRLE